jgi:outer membrane protein OmpA-like peptidoglycan-associated protein
VAAKKDAVDRLQQALPGTEIRDQITVLPSGLAEIEPRIAEVRRDVAGLEAEVEPEIQGVKRDLAGLRTVVEPGLAEVKRGLAEFKSTVEPEIVDVKRELAAIDPAIEGMRREIAAAERAAVRRALDRAGQRLGEVGAGLPGLEAAVTEAQGKDVVRRSARIVEQSQRQLGGEGAEADPQRMAGLSARLADETRKLRVVGAELSGLIAAGMARAYAPAAVAPPADARESAEQLSAETERLAVLTTSIAQTLALKSSLPRPAAREKLEAWTRANAIFFTNGIDYRSPRRALETVEALAGLLRENDLLVRVVGYTDDQGGQLRNLPLSQQRAEKVVAELVARGVPASRLVAVGRLDALDLSPRAGDASPNRRVQFEVGFDGEGAE